MKKYLITLSLILLFFANVNFILAAECAKVQVSLPGMAKDTCLPSLPEYVKNLYDVFLGVIGILAAVIMMWGGFKWIVAAGSPEKIKGAQTTMWAGISGLILALFSYMILYVVNPQLTSLKLIEPKVVGRKELITTWCSEVQVSSFTLAGDATGATKVPKNETKCGTKYIYTTGSNGTASECIGDGDCRKKGEYCSPGSPNNPLAEGIFSCHSGRERCERLNVDKLHAREGFIEKQCPSFDIAGIGICEYPGSSKSTALNVIKKDTDRCFWRAILDCETGLDRVECSLCNDVGLKGKDVSFVSLGLGSYNVSAIGMCVTSAIGDVYAYDSAGEVSYSTAGEYSSTIYPVKAICCHQRGAPINSPSYFKIIAE